MSASLHVTDMKLTGDAYIVLEVTRDGSLGIYAAAWNEDVHVTFPAVTESLDEVVCLISSLQTWVDLTREALKAQEVK